MAKLSLALENVRIFSTTRRRSEPTSDLATAAQQARFDAELVVDGHRLTLTFAVADLEALRPALERAAAQTRAKFAAIEQKAAELVTSAGQTLAGHRQSLADLDGEVASLSKKIEDVQNSAQAALEGGDFALSERLEGELPALAARLTALERRRPVLVRLADEAEAADQEERDNFLRAEKNRLQTALDAAVQKCVEPLARQLAGVLSDWYVASVAAGAELEPPLGSVRYTAAAHRFGSVPPPEALLEQQRQHRERQAELAARRERELEHLWLASGHDPNRTLRQG